MLLYTRLSSLKALLEYWVHGTYYTQPQAGKNKGSDLISKEDQALDFHGLNMPLLYKLKVLGPLFTEDEWQLPGCEVLNNVEAAIQVPQHKHRQPYTIRVG